MRFGSLLNRSVMTKVYNFPMIVSHPPHTAAEVQAALRAATNSEKAAFFPRFFKTGPGQYGEGDQFIGVTVPEMRKVSKAFWQLPEAEVLKLLHSPIHEDRATALFIMVLQFEKGSSKGRTKLHQLYLNNTAYINNWDLVDLSSRQIVGDYLSAEDISLLIKLAHSKSLWEQRIAIVSTFSFIYQGNSKPTLEIAETLVDHPHDLIHKAVGWLLREVGKRNSREIEKKFLDKHAHHMPRTMLRYAIEHFSEEEKRHYMGLKASRQK